MKMETLFHLQTTHNSFIPFKVLLPLINYNKSKGFFYIHSF